MTIDLYPSLIHEGDLSPDAFGEQVDNVCHEIHASVKGMYVCYTAVNKMRCSILSFLTLYLKICRIRNG